MATVQELSNYLKSLLKLLHEEKEFLLHSDGDKIAEIVKIKNEYIEKLSDFEGLNIEDNKKVMELIVEINSLQEDNLLLTKQALSFQNALLESISKAIRRNPNTYSSKGNYESNNNINLINQSV